SFLCWTRRPLSSPLFPYTTLFRSPRETGVGDRLPGDVDVERAVRGVLDDAATGELHPVVEDLGEDADRAGDDGERGDAEPQPPVPHQVGAALLQPPPDPPPAADAAPPAAGGLRGPPGRGVAED